MNTFAKDFEIEKAKMMAHMQAHAEFTNAEVLAVVGGPTTRREHYLQTLRKSGVMRLVRREGSLPFYTVLPAEEAQARTAAMRSTPEGALWTSMRTMRRFTQEDIFASVAPTDIKVEMIDVQRYCAALLDAGFLKVLEKARPNSGRTVRYMLLQDTGPLPPKVRRMQVLVDQNTDRVAHVRGARL